MPAAEFFYLDEDGQLQDVDLHAGTLDSGDAEEKQRQSAIQRQLKVSLSRADVENFTGPIDRDGFEDPE